MCPQVKHIPVWEGTKLKQKNSKTGHVMFKGLYVQRSECSYECWKVVYVLVFTDYQHFFFCVWLKSYIWNKFETLSWMLEHGWLLTDILHVGWCVWDTIGWLFNFLFFPYIFFLSSSFLFFYWSWMYVYKWWFALAKCRTSLVWSVKFLFRRYNEYRLYSHYECVRFMMDNSRNSRGWIF